MLARGGGQQKIERGQPRWGDSREVEEQEERDSTDDAQGHLGADCKGSRDVVWVVSGTNETAKAYSGKRGRTLGNRENDAAVHLWYEKNLVNNAR